MKMIVLTNRAAKEFDALPDTAKADIDEALTGYAITGRGNVKKLQGREGYRLRVGNYRVIFDEDQTTILAIQIGRRATTTYRN